MFLARHARHVHVVIRGEDLGAGMSDYLVGRSPRSAGRITVHTRTEVAALHGERHREAVTLADRGAGTDSTHPVANVFCMLGAVPNTEWLEGTLTLDERGFICTGGQDARLLETSVPGVFAVGDVRSGSVKRVASAVGEGSVVVSAIHQVLAA